jgi:hypothetical protein
MVSPRVPVVSWCSHAAMLAASSAPHVQAVLTWEYPDGQVPEGGAVLAVAEDVLDGGPVPVPVLCRGGLVRCGHVQVRQDEAVGVDRVGAGEPGDGQGALAGVQGPAPP